MYTITVDDDEDAEKAGDGNFGTNHQRGRYAGNGKGQLRVRLNRGCLGSLQKKAYDCPAFTLSGNQQMLKLVEVCLVC